MRHSVTTLFAALLLPIGSAIAQTGPTPAAAPSARAPAPHGLTPIPTAALQAGSAMLAGQLLIDEPRAGEVWVRGDAYKAAFGAGHTTFYPFFGPTAAQHDPVAFAAPVVRLGESVLPVDHVAPRAVERRIDIDRGAFVERYHLTAAGIEQTFVFDRLDRRDALSLRIPVATELVAAPADQGLRFHGPRGNVTYGQAIAVDAVGNRQPLTTRWTGDAIDIRVPAAFVAAATLPLVVDPLILTEYEVVPGPVGIGNPDLAFDSATATYLLVFEQPFTATDHDVYGLRLDGSLDPIGIPFTIDYTTDSWTLPRVANHRVARQFLTVAEVSSSATAPSHVAGRILDLQPQGQGPQFDIARVGVSGHLSGAKHRPDVGGGAASVTTPIDTYLVVWEREYSMSDFDIHARAVTVNGTLVGSGPMTLSNSGAFDARPSISNSNVHSDQWQICYQRQIFGTTPDWDILGARVRFNGVVLGSDELIVGNAQIQGHCAVSSAMLGPDRPTMVAYERRTSLVGESNIELVLVDRHGTPSQPYQLTAFESIATSTTAFLPMDQVRPSVATDGARCVVAYREKNTTTNRYETYVTLVGVDFAGNNLSVQEPRVLVGHSPLGAWIEDSPASIGSRWDAAAARVRYDIALDLQDLVHSLHSVGVQGYLGHVTNGGFASRSTGCGNVGIVATGLPAYGSTVTFHAQGSGGLPGFIVGAPTSYAVPICPHCTVGVSGSSVLGVSSLAVDIPPAISFLGLTFSVQALEIVNAGGACLGQFQGSQTLDFTIQ